MYWKRKMVLDGLKDVLLKNEPIDKINTLIKEVVNRMKKWNLMLEMLELTYMNGLIFI